MSFSTVFIPQGIQKIAEVVTTSDVDYVEFTNLNINKDEMYMIVGSVVNGSIYLTAFVENDLTLGNYSYVAVGFASASVAGYGGNYPFIGYCGSAGYLINFIAYIFRDVNGRIAFYSFMRETYGGNGRVYLMWSQPKDNLTTFRIVMCNSTPAVVTGGIKAGSRFRLYKVVSV